MTQLEIKDKTLPKKPLRVAGFPQNCYLIGTSTKDGEVRVTSSPNREQEKYTILRKKMLPNGYVEQIEEEPYPINSASVTSYAEGADYRNDPAQAVANAPERVNLGDVTQAQKFLENPQNYARVFKEVAAKFDEYFKKVSLDTKNQPQQQQQQDSKGE